MNKYIALKKQGTVQPIPEALIEKTEKHVFKKITVYVKNHSKETRPKIQAVPLISLITQKIKIKFEYNQSRHCLL